MFKGVILFFTLSILFLGCTSKTISPLPSPPPPPPKEMPSEPPLKDTPQVEKEIEQKEISEVIPDDGQKEKLGEEEKPVAKKIPEEADAEDFTKGLTKDEAIDVTKDVVQLPPPPELPTELPIVEAPEEPPLPDLAITGLLLNSKKRVLVTMSNIGNSPLPMELGNLKIFVEGKIKESCRLDRLFDQSFLQPNENMTFTSFFTLRGRREVQAYVETSQEMRELNIENNHLESVLEGLPNGPDIIVQDLDLSEDFNLYMILSNAGEVDLRKGVPFRIRVFVNGLKTSDFDHYIPGGLKANFGNCYTIDPPHRIGIVGTAKVKVSISPKLHSDDVYLGNNTLERTFAIFPFQMIPQGIQEFSFFVPSPPVKEDVQTEKIKAEVRWEGEESSFLISFHGKEQVNSFQPILEHSPLKVEFPIHLEGVKSESQWKVSVANLMEKKVEGCLIVQHP
jgi:hypothetical protein